MVSDYRPYGHPQYQRSHKRVAGLFRRRLYGSSYTAETVHSTILLCEAETSWQSAQLWTAKHLDDGDEISIPKDDGGKRRQESTRTIPQSTPQRKCGRRCAAKPHLYAAPKCLIKLKLLENRRFESLFAECGPKAL